MDSKLPVEAWLCPLTKSRDAVKCACILGTKWSDKVCPTKPTKDEFWMPDPRLRQTKIVQGHSWPQHGACGASQAIWASPNAHMHLCPHPQRLLQEELHNWYLAEKCAEVQLVVAQAPFMALAPSKVLCNARVSG